jgi:hypothetical protein
MASIGAVCLLLAGCGGDEAPKHASWAAEFAEARQNATSDFERAALADDKITAAEYEEAISRYVRCMQEKFGDPDKFSANKSVDGVYTYTLMTTAKTNEVDAALQDKYDAICVKGTKAFIEYIYVDRLRYPDKGDPNKARVACLKRHKLAPESYTVDQLKVDMENDPGSKTIVNTEDPPVGQCIESPQL